MTNTAKLRAQIEKSLKLKDLRKQIAKESIYVEYLSPREMNRIYTAEYMEKQRLKKWEFENETLRAKSLGSESLS